MTFGAFKTAIDYGEIEVPIVDLPLLLRVARRALTITVEPDVITLETAGGAVHYDRKQGFALSVRVIAGLLDQGFPL